MGTAQPRTVVREFRQLSDRAGSQLPSCCRNASSLNLPSAASPERSSITSSTDDLTAVGDKYHSQNNDPNSESRQACDLGGMRNNVRRCFSRRCTHSQRQNIVPMRTICKWHRFVSNLGFKNLMLDDASRSMFGSHISPREHENGAKPAVARNVAVDACLM